MIKKYAILQLFQGDQLYWSVNGNVERLLHASLFPTEEDAILVMKALKGDKFSLVTVYVTE